MDMQTPPDLLTIAGKQYRSRLLVGSGKYKDLAETHDGDGNRISREEIAADEPAAVVMVVRHGAALARADEILE